MEPSLFARDFAREMYLHGAKRLPAEEDGAQDRDVSLIMSLTASELPSSELTASELPSLRAKAAEEGRYRLALAVTGCAAQPLGPAGNRGRGGLRRPA
ncbi:hypothetical protein ACFYPN_03450 [Streptomyces sp. NPDC005576]|uniref:hypothetical protein n=1 Tax=Streptomyces sp. NPDC005576 TaxID=3364726 RepID=UPI0036917C7D